MLFKPFLQARSDISDVLIIPLNQDPKMDVGAQARYIETKLPDGPLILVAESYSGRVAYELLANPKHREVKHIIFVASFLSAPTYLSKIARLLPNYLYNQPLVIKGIGSRIAFGSYVSGDLEKLLLESLSKVPTEVLRARISEISRMLSPKRKLLTPSTYVGASSDNLVTRGAIEDFETLCMSFKSTQISGSHFLMQTNPRGVWDVIENVAI